MCEIARVSRSGYYKWLKTTKNTPKDYNDYLLIKELFEKGKRKYGWRTIQMKLLEQGIVMNHKKILRIKNKYKLITKIRRKNPYKEIMKKTREHRTFGNILARNFEQNNPRKVFCTDITYLPFNGRMAYLSAIKDIASREIIAWNLSQHLQMDIIFNTIKNLEENQDMPSLENILIHSDQGSHYTSPDFILKVQELNMVQSMSRKGNCIDNAPMESFFGHFKDEVDYKKCRTFEELRGLTAEYIKYYNNKRRQWNLQKMTPVEYRNYLFSVNTPK
jgi:transposase InsO family protein